MFSSVVLTPITACYMKLDLTEEHLYHLFVLHASSGNIVDEMEGFKSYVGIFAPSKCSTRLFKSAVQSRKQYHM